MSRLYLFVALLACAIDRRCLFCLLVSVIGCQGRARLLDYLLGCVTARLHGLLACICCVIVCLLVRLLACLFLICFFVHELLARLLVSLRIGRLVG